MRVLLILSALAVIALASEQAEKPLATYLPTRYLANPFLRSYVPFAGQYAYTTNIKANDYHNFVNVRADFQPQLSTQPILLNQPLILNKEAAAPLYKALPAASYYAAPSHGYIAAPAIIERRVVGQAVTGEGLLAHKTQYHSQDEFGAAHYGHAEPLQAHNAVQDSIGNKAGTYSYYAPDGRLYTTSYLADDKGYHAKTSATPSFTKLATPLKVSEKLLEKKSEDHHRHRRDAALLPATPLAATPLAYKSLLKEGSLSTIVNNPGHAVSYRIDGNEELRAHLVQPIYTHPINYAYNPALNNGYRYAIPSQQLYYPHFNRLSYASPLAPWALA